jgi:protein-tyrosine phosphatase
MDIAPIDDHERLFVSSAIDDWALIDRLDIHVVADLDSELDRGVPTAPGKILYLYFPIRDGELPDLDVLHSTATLLAELHRAGRRVLVHCGLGLNRSALLAGVVLHRLGWEGAAAVERLRDRRPGALFNDRFSEYLMALGAARPEADEG